MKKFLSLVLALVMTMSLVTISAGAKDFTDADKVAYTEAIDVMSAVKVIDGYTDGSFKPTTQLNRGQAAKILCNMLLGPTTAAALKADAAPFKDVAAENTFAGYIAYCVKAGIIDGYTDGTFKPTAPLTGYAFMKYLLGALGYDKDVEGYNGANWSINVAKQALAIGLDDGLVNDFDGTKIVTREEACLFALNAMKATMVEYDAKTTINVGGAEVTISGSKAQPVYWDEGIKNDGNIDDDGFVQFAEKYFSKLVLNATNDDLARPADVWTFKGKEVGTYALTADETYTEEVEGGEIYKDLGLTKSTTVSAYFVNGVPQGTVTLSKGDTETKFGGNGVETTVYYFSDGSVWISEVQYYVGDVAAKYAATSKKDAYITIAPRIAGGVAGNFTTEDFNVDDIVLYTYSQKPGATGIKSVEVAETVKGALTNYTVGKQAVVGGTTYKYSENIANGASSTLINKNIEVEVVLDKYGYAIDITDNGVKNYAVITKIKAGSGDFNDELKAQLLLTDGTTTETITLTNAAIADLEAGDIVSYTINSKGKYTLTELSDVASTTATSTDLIKNGDDTLHDTNFGTGAELKANGKTTFLVKDSADNYTAYTGIKNVPTITSKSTNSGMLVNSYAKAGAVAATLVYVDASQYANVTSSDTLFILGKSSTKVTEDEKIGSYYTYNAIVNGEITKINSATKLTSYELYNAVSYDANNIATVGTALTTKGTATVAKANDVIGLAGSYYNYTNDCKVFYINVDGDIIPTSVNAIATDANDEVWFKLVNSEVTYIFVKEVAGTTAPTLSGDVQVIDFVVDTATTAHFGLYVEDGHAITAAEKLTVDQIGALLEADGWTDVQYNGTNWSFKKGYASYSGVTISQHQVFAVSVNATPVANHPDCKVTITSKTPGYVYNGETIGVTIEATGIAFSNNTYSSCTSGLWSGGVSLTGTTSKVASTSVTAAITADTVVQITMG